MHVHFSIPDGNRYRWRPLLPPSGEIVVLILIGFAAYFVGDILLRILSGVLPG